MLGEIKILYIYSVVKEYVSNVHAGCQGGHGEAGCCSAGQGVHTLKKVLSALFRQDRINKYPQ